MSQALVRIDPVKRIAEKAASRHRDEQRVALGRISRADLGKENGFFSGMKILRMVISNTGTVLKG
jgi:hypothetical protein